MNGRNPDWTREETVLLLDLYLRRPRFSRHDPEVCRLSEVLNAAPTAPADRLGTYRNPVGVAMKLRNLAKQDPAFAATGRQGLKAGGRVDATVWREFAHDRRRLAEEVQGIHARWGVGAAAALRNWSPSRGPPPLLGSFAQSRIDGDTEVYLLLLEGPVAAVLPHHQIKPGWAVMKVGRSNGVVRRCAELNAGLPPAASLRWRPLAARTFPSAGTADQQERHLLEHAAQAGWSLGGEFVLAPVSKMRRALGTDQMEQIRQPSRR